MKYTRITIDFKENPSRFNRTILVKGNPNLDKLAIFFSYILGAAFEHCHLIETENECYVMACFMEGPTYKSYKYLGNYKLSDLPKTFEFKYDTGEGYIFTCNKVEEIDYDSRYGFILEKAVGQGIWEDNIHSLYAYLDGKINPKKRGNDEKNGYYLPWNFDNEKFSDFDKPIDIEEINKTLTKKFSQILSLQRKYEREYLDETPVCLDDIPMDEYFKEMTERLKKELNK